MMKQTGQFKSHLVLFHRQKPISYLNQAVLIESERTNTVDVSIQANITSQEKSFIAS
jgi:hypothetical protein